MQNLIQNVLKKYGSSDKYSLIDLGYIFQEASTEDLIQFATKYNISVVAIGSNIKQTLIETLFIYFLDNPNITKDLKKEKIDPLDNLTRKMTEFPNLAKGFRKFDFISKAELKNVFADWCADIGISVYNTPENNDFQLDLYLTKKDPILKTESVVMLTGSEVQSSYNDSLFKKIEKSGEISDWKVFVTTSLGALLIGYDRLIKDMEKLDCWTYIVNPVDKRILGLTKGGKSKEKNVEIRDDYMRKLPPQPIRAPSQVVKLSKYAWSEKDAYDQKKITLFTINLERIKPKDEDAPKYADIFRNLIAIASNTGLSIFSYANTANGVDDTLISGFLSAMDSFVNELSRGSSLREIDYQNFKINAASGQILRLIAITTKSPDDIFKDRLIYLVNLLESQFAEQIDQFVQTGNRGTVDEKKWIENIKETLSI